MVPSGNEVNSNAEFWRHAQLELKAQASEMVGKVMLFDLFGIIQEKLQELQRYIKILITR